MPNPVQRCKLCGNTQEVTPSGSGFPPKIALKKLRAKCAAAGCPCEPVYTAGFEGFSGLVQAIPPRTTPGVAMSELAEVDPSPQVDDDYGAPETGLEG